MQIYLVLPTHSSQVIGSDLLSLRLFARAYTGSGGSTHSKVDIILIFLNLRSLRPDDNQLLHMTPFKLSLQP
jgi:hypothetical protein